MDIDTLISYVPFVLPLVIVFIGGEIFASNAPGILHLRGFRFLTFSLPQRWFGVCLGLAIIAAGVAVGLVLSHRI